MGSSKLISIREYGRQLGCSDTLIHKAIKSGKIVKGLVRQPGERPRINPEVADREWGNAFNPSRIQNPTLLENLAKRSPQGRAAADAVGLTDQEPESSGAGSARPKVQDGNLTKVRLKREAIRALDAELDYKKKLGTLVEKELVYRTLYGFGKELRQAFEALPEQFIDDIRAQDTRNEAVIVMRAAIRQVLERLSNMTEKEIQEKL